MRMVASIAAVAACLVGATPATPQPGKPPHLQLWLCVHQHERTAWNDPGWPYLGGLQLGQWFVGHYMPLVRHPPGMPNTWSPLQQMWFAERAYRVEHYSHSWLWGQWPPSRGGCF
jgi:hypothetical protein